MPELSAYEWFRFIVFLLATAGLFILPVLLFLVLRDIWKAWKCSKEQAEVQRRRDAWVAEVEREKQERESDDD